MKLSTLTGAMAFAFGAASVAFAQEPTASDSLRVERGRFWLPFLSDEVPPQALDKRLFQGITLTKAQEVAYQQLMMSYHEERSINNPSWLNDASQETFRGWQNLREYKFARAYLGVLTPPQQTLFQKNLTDALTKFHRAYESWERSKLPDTLAVEREYGFEMLLLNVPISSDYRKREKYAEILQGITLTKAQEAAYHQLITSHYAEMQNHYYPHVDARVTLQERREERKARVQKLQALEQQYVKDWHAVLTPEQQGFLDTHVADLRAEICKTFQASWEKQQKMDPMWVNDNHFCDDLRK